MIVGVPDWRTARRGLPALRRCRLGLMKTHVADADQLFNVDNNDFGIDLGVGAMGFMTDHVGFRGDVRYFRDLQNTVTATATSRWRPATSISGAAPSGLAFRW